MRGMVTATAFTILGIYIAQQYDVPNVRNYLEEVYKSFSEWEKSNRK